MIRVVIVDDSAIFRSLLKGRLQSEPDIQVVGQTGDGREAIDLVARLKPDVVTMDVVMPGQDGAETTRQIMEGQPTPILVISALRREAILFQMLAAGALDVMAKPDGGDPAALAPIVERVRTLAHARARPARPVPAPPPGPPPATRDRPASALVVVASSAGGPHALGEILGGLPVGLPAAIVIVQHIAVGFTAGLAHWLDGVCPLPVTLAEAGQYLAAGTVLIAPELSHLAIVPQRRVALDMQTGPLSFVRPAADITLRTAAEVYGPAVLAVVLTGMGRDGAAGAEAVKAHGGRVIVQDRVTSAVWGMPQAALPFADAELPLPEVARYLIRFAREHAR